VIRFFGQHYRVDRSYGGTLKIVGTTKNKATPSNLPVSRKVSLFDQRRQVLVRQTWSDAAGNYVFDNIKDGLYFIAGFDHTGQYNGTIQTDVKPSLNGGTA
jgi:hypothetical protein